MNGNKARSGFALTLLAACLFWQCQSEQPKKAPVEEGKQAQKAAAGEATIEAAPSPGKAVKTSPPMAKKKSPFPEGKSALDGVDALKYLPADALFVAVAANPQGILDRLGREHLIKKYAKYYEMGVAEVTQAVGHNILVPANLKEIGLDPTAAVGFALLSVNRPRGVFFAKLSDPDKFKTTIYAVSGKLNERLEPHVVGEAIAICPSHDEEVCFVLRDGYLFFHFADMPDEEALAAAKDFAGGPKEGSLADLPEMKSASANLKYGKDAAAYVNTAGLMSQTMNMDSTWALESVNRSKKELERAKKENNPEDIKYWEERVRDDQKWYDEQTRRNAARKEAMEGLFDGLGGVSFGLEITSKAIKMKSYVQIAENSLWARIMKPVAGKAAVLYAIDERPLYLFHAGISLPEYLNVVDRLVGMEGFSVAQGKEVIKAATGLDLEADILSVFTGEIGFAMFGDLARALDGMDKAPLAFGGAATLGVTDVAKATALLDKVAGLSMIEGMVKKLDGNKGWEVPIPEWKPVYISFAGKQLCISTDPGFASRVASGKPGKYMATLENGEVKELLEMPDISGLGMLDFGSFSFVFFGMARSFGGMDMAMAEAPSLQDVPYSEEYKKQKQELEDHRKKVRKMRDDIERETYDRVAKMLERIGITIAVGKNVPGGQVGFGGHYVADESITALIDHLIEDGMALEELDRTRRKEVWALEDKTWDMQKKLEEKRAQDVQKHMEQKIEKEAEGAVGAVKILGAPTGDGKLVIEGAGNAKALEGAFDNIEGGAIDSGNLEGVKGEGIKVGDPKNIIGAP